MSYCKHCGSEVGDAKFCPNCGKAQHVEQYTEKSCSNGRRLHCPHCRSTQLTALVESANADHIRKGAAAAKGFGLSAHGATAANRNYWMCHDCGHKLRNIENLQAEIDYAEIEMNKWKRWGIAASVVTVVLMMLAAAAGDVMMVFLCAPLGLFILYAGASFWVSSREKKRFETLTDEKKRLEENCYL